MTTLLTVEGCTVTRGRKTLLHDVSFQHESGVLGLAGVNGAGKTTLLSLCAGQFRPREGVILIEDDSGKMRPSKAVRMLPQAFDYPRNLTLLELVSYSAWVNGCGSRSDALADRALSQVQLSDHRHTRLGAASGGMVHRAGLAAVLVSEPKIILLDEPTAGVDPEQRLVLRSLIAEIAQERPVIMSTHLSEDIDALCETLLVLGDGAVRYIGSLRQAKDVAGKESLEEAIVALSKTGANS